MKAYIAIVHKSSIGDFFISSAACLVV